MAESDEAASIQTVTGWVSRDGHFWGKDERMARYSGSTHKICDKNPEHGVVEQRSWCRQCHNEAMEKRWNEMPKTAYTPESFPLHLYDTDRYFFDEVDLMEWLEENKINPVDVRLTKCKPSYPDQIDPDEHFCDILPEDGEVPEDVREAFEKLNEVLKRSEPLSWLHDDKQGITLPADFLKADSAQQGSATTDKVAWGIHIPGPDDWHAAPSEAAANHMAARHNIAMNAHFEKNPPCPHSPPIGSVIAKALPWPWGVNDHAEALIGFDAEAWGLADQQTQGSSNA